MSSERTADDRVALLNDAPLNTDGRYVLYWMQQSQRVGCNPALAHAVGLADELDLPVVVVFALFDDHRDANARHYAFMLEGLAEVGSGLEALGIPFVVRRGRAPAVCAELGARAAAVVCDRGYLRLQKAWRAHIAEEARCRVIQVEGDVVVPVDRASTKREYAARTLRPKINRLLDGYLDPPSHRRPRRSGLELPRADKRLRSQIDVGDPAGALATLRVDREVSPVDRFRGGESEARRRLEAFLASSLKGYADGRNDPSDPQCSNLSPYLHFGQISPLEVALAARSCKRASDDDRGAFLEELIVRRELSINFVHREPDYDRFASLPEWARKTLHEHRDDPREHVYTRRQLEEADTHDPYWNAAMREMLRTGYMHNYMRMYWGKKIIEWTRSPPHAYRTTLALNNRYFLDGRDANSYTGVGWVYGLHDRPWTRRPVFGTVRYMNAAGLRRKFDMDGYVSWSRSL